MPSRLREFLSNNFDGSSFVWHGFTEHPVLSILGSPLVLVSVLLLPLRAIITLCEDSDEGIELNHIQRQQDAASTRPRYQNTDWNDLGYSSRGESRARSKASANANGGAHGRGGSVGRQNNELSNSRRNMTHPDWTLSQFPINDKYSQKNPLDINHGSRNEEHFDKRAEQNGCQNTHRASKSTVTIPARARSSASRMSKVSAGIRTASSPPLRPPAPQAHSVMSTYPANRSTASNRGPELAAPVESYQNLPGQARDRMAPAQRSPIQSPQGYTQPAKDNQSRPAQGLASTPHTGPSTYPWRYGSQPYGASPIQAHPAMNTPQSLRQGVPLYGQQPIPAGHSPSERPTQATADKLHERTLKPDVQPQAHPGTSQSQSAHGGLSGDASIENVQDRVSDTTSETSDSSSSCACSECVAPTGQPTDNITTLPNPASTGQ